MAIDHLMEALTAGTAVVAVLATATAVAMAMAIETAEAMGPTLLRAAASFANQWVRLYMTHHWLRFLSSNFLLFHNQLPRRRLI